MERVTALRNQSVTIYPAGGDSIDQLICTPTEVDVFMLYENGLIRYWKGEDHTVIPPSGYSRVTWKSAPDDTPNRDMPRAAFG